MGLTDILLFMEYLFKMYRYEFSEEILSKFSDPYSIRDWIEDKYEKGQCEGIVRQFEIKCRCISYYKEHGIREISEEEVKQIVIYGEYQDELAPSF